jgi:MFS transporter, OPA family, glycerol-3-phosphate transporter
MAADYQRLRWQVFAGIFLGYAAYYLVRKTYSLVIPDLQGLGLGLSKEELGRPLTLMSTAYGFSKFISGCWSDQSNPRYFLPLGLALSACIIAACGVWKELCYSMALVGVLQGLNGWFNGMGWAPCGKTMVHWFSTQERGRIVSLWNVAHNVGGGLMPLVGLAGLALFNDWGAKLYFNAFIALAVALLALVLIRDTPQSCGLPPVEVYKDDYPPAYDARHEEVLTTKQIFLEHVLPSRLLWYIAVANAFLYFVRYGVADWIPTYLKETKGFDLKQSAYAGALFEWAAVPGTILCGWLSDRVFQSRRAPALLLFMLPTLLGLVVYGCNGNGPLWVDLAALILVGFFIYGPIMIIGLQALDLVPKKAAGTAAGFTGFFGYVFGSAFAGSGIGWLADQWRWQGVMWALWLSCVLTMVFCAMTLGTDKRQR